MDKSKELSSDLQVLFKEEKPRVNDIIYFADEAKVKLPGKKMEVVVGLSGVTIDYFLRTDPIIVGPVSRGSVIEPHPEDLRYSVINDGQIYKNLMLEKSEDGTGRSLAGALARLILKSQKDHKKKNQESNIFAYFVCNSFASSLNHTYDFLIQNEVRPLPPIVTIGGNVSKSLEGRREIIDMFPKEYKFKQIVGIYSPKKYSV